MAGRFAVARVTEAPRLSALGPVPSPYASAARNGWTGGVSRGCSEGFVRFLPGSEEVKHRMHALIVSTPPAQPVGCKLQHGARVPGHSGPFANETAEQLQPAVAGDVALGRHWAGRARTVKE